MTTQIEQFTEAHLRAVVDLSLRAWAPVFESLERVFEPAVYQHFHPDGWRVAQANAVEETCRSAEVSTWVAVESGSVAGFVAVKLHGDAYGEIYMIAVDPQYQRRGIASALTEFAQDWMRSKGIAVAMVETGADAGHAPARATYEAMGFGLFPVARYFKRL